MPVGVLEAAACGLPIVSTDAGGVPFFLRDGETGLLVTDGDAHAMAAKVKRLLKEPQLAATLSRNGRVLTEACGWASVRGQWEALFEDVLARA